MDLVDLKEMHQIHGSFMAKIGNLDRPRSDDEEVIFGDYYSLSVLVCRFLNIYEVSDFQKLRVPYAIQLTPELSILARRVMSKLELLAPVSVEVEKQSTDSQR